ncbi:MAG: DNA repair protein RadC [Endomicrobium sp.]|uniref:RadC family protein n=1 Tax=Candidatus Endomicrobiellum pyrsonymphae TaxID=1408203 RepID=UPI00357CA464|nr:DNA repair protein RadC [Endomicrobium sp.]
MNTKESPHYIGHRDRLRIKFLTGGFDHLTDYEILELVLTYALPRKDVKILAKEMIDKFGNLKQVFDADIEELKQIKNISDYSAGFLFFLRKFTSLYLSLEIKEKDKLLSPLEVKNYLISSLSGEKIEKVYAIVLNAGNRVTDCLEIEKGTVNKSLLMPRKIAEIALNHKAAAIIIAHNHPGGNLKPSQNDIDITGVVKKALEAIEVSLLDHIVIANNNYFSFKEYGLI